MYNSGAKQYQQVNVTSEVLDADPHRLIQLLLEICSWWHCAAPRIWREDERRHTLKFV